MVLDQPYQFYWPWVPEELHTYGEAVRFAEDMFKYFNGKVNPHFPAKGITFGNNNSPGVLGKNVVDIVVIYPHNIMRYVHENIEMMGTARKVSCLLKGTIIYVVIHELLHMEQDFDAYYKKYKNPIPRIELACHVMTKKYIDYLYDHGCYIADIPLDYFESFTPGVANFFDISAEKIAKYEEKGESLFYYADPINKALYFWDLLLKNHFDDYSPTGSIRNMVNVDDENKTPIGTIIVTFYIDREVIAKDMYIKFAGKWLSPDIILNIPRTIVLLEDTSNGDEHGVDISSRVGFCNDAPSCARIDISMETRPDNSMFDVVYRLRKDQHPIFRV